MEEVDWNREVRRCYNCQKYGHIAKDCPQKAAPTCGNCTGAHDSRQCDGKAPKKCVNCHGRHRSGDAHCPEQIKMVKRMRARLEE